MRLSERSTGLWQVERFIRWFGPALKLETGVRFGKPFYHGPVGVWLMHRDRWQECRGYDESMLYWGFMEIEMVERLQTNFELVPWDVRYGCDFYHLEHFHPGIRRATDRRVNRVPAVRPLEANDGDWGLAD